jgi:hypothetical protein
VRPILFFQYLILSCKDGVLTSHLLNKALVHMLHLDHLTVTALTLEEEVAHVRRALGVVMPFGGAHPLMGTHNHLMRLGERVFLEVIAPDFDVTPKRRRWFALDDAAMRNSLERSPAARNLGYTRRGSPPGAGTNPRRCR